MRVRVRLPRKLSLQQLDLGPIWSLIPGKAERLLNPPPPFDPAYVETGTSRDSHSEPFGAAVMIKSCLRSGNRESSAKDRALFSVAVISVRCQKVPVDNRIDRREQRRFIDRLA